MASPAKTLYYPVWVPNDAQRSLLWGEPCDAPSEAALVLKAKLDRGRATLAFVVRCGQRGAEALATFIWPASARKIIRHWLELQQALAQGPARTPGGE